MKKHVAIYFTLILLVLLVPISSFAQDTEDEEMKRELAKIDLDKKFYISLDLGVGASEQMSTAYTNGENTPGISYQVGVSFIYFFNKYIGFQFELGNHLFRCRDKDRDSSEFINYDLQYIFVSFIPLFRFNKFFFSLGFYFGFVVKSEFESNPLTDGEDKYYNVPDVGLRISAGYLFDITKNTAMSVGVQCKVQLQNFRFLEDYGGQIFAAFLQIGLLFET